MHKPGKGLTITRRLTALGLALAMAQTPLLPQTPAHAAADATNFNVRNCAHERIFVCSFDKTDGSLKIPYKARGIQPEERKEFGCASLKKCKVIIGVSKRKAAQTLSSTMQAGLAGGTVGVGGAAGAGTFGAIYIAGNTAGIAGIIANAGTISSGLLMSTGIGAVVAGVIAGGAIGGLEIADGWSDGEVCNQVRRAAQKAGMKPKLFMQNGKKYKVMPQYAVDENGNAYVNADGTAVFTYKAEQGDACPSSTLETLIVAK